MKAGAIKRKIDAKIGAKEGREQSGRLLFFRFKTDESNSWQLDRDGSYLKKPRISILFFQWLKWLLFGNLNFELFSYIDLADKEVEGESAK